MKSLLEELFRFDQQQRPEVEEYRRQLLDRYVTPVAFLGFVALGLAGWRAVEVGLWHVAGLYAAAVGAICLAILARRWSLKVRSSVLLAGLYAVGIAALLRLGVGSCTGVMVLIAFCGLTAIFRGARATLWAIGLCVLGMTAVGVAMVQGLVALPSARFCNSQSIWQWLLITLTFAAVMLVLIIPLLILGTKLAELLSSGESQRRELEQSNDQLRGEIERRQLAEEAVLASEQRYRNIFETASVAIWEEDLSAVRAALAELRSQGVEDLRAHLDSHPQLAAELARLVQVCDVNQAALEIYRAESKDELLDSITKVFAPEAIELFGEVLVALAEGRSRFEGETVNQTLAGERIHVLLGATIPEDPAASVLVTVVDITDRKMIEQTLAEAEKMEAVGTLAGGIAHDFNNLLMGIQGHVSLMERHVSDRQRMRGYLRSVKEQVDTAASLTKQLLGFALGGKYDVRTADLAQLISLSLTVFGRTRKEIRTHAQLPADLWTCDVDQSQIEQVLLNLYLNAWQAMPDGGDLRVEASNVTLDAQAVETFSVPTGDYVRISVTDTGTGMDAATCERVFEPFFTTGKLGRGTGLGLASAYGIVKNHGGLLKVSSEPGQGSTFDIYLPASKRPVAVAEPSMHQIQQSQGSEKILLVDDEKNVLLTTTMMLEELGYEVVAARGGAEAVKQLEQNRDVALVILDMIMPDMGGSEVYERLRAIAGDVPVLISSGYSLDAKAEAMLKRGCRGFIQKRFGLDDLSGKVRELIELG